MTANYFNDTLLACLLCYIILLTDSVGLIDHWLYNSSSSIDEPATPHNIKSRSDVDQLSCKENAILHGTTMILSTMLERDSATYLNVNVNNTL